MAYNKERDPIYEETIDVISRAIKEEYKNFNFSIMLPEFVKMCKGNGNDAIILSRIFYWFRPNSSGGNKFHSIMPDGREAFAKSASQMALETGLDESTVKRSYQRLKELGFIKTFGKLDFGKNIRWKGHQTTHMLIQGEEFAEAFWEAHRQLELAEAESWEDEELIEAIEAEPLVPEYAQKPRYKKETEKPKKLLPTLKRKRLPDLE